MITLKTTSEKISAWLRNREGSLNGLGSPIMSCAIFASAAPLSRTAFGAESGAEPTTKRDSRPRALATRHLFQRTADAGRGPSQDRSWYRQLRGSISGTRFGSRRKKHRKANV
jgi:hypothetical protein